MIQEISTSMLKFIWQILNDQNEKRQQKSFDHQIPSYRPTEYQIIVSEFI